MANNCIQLRDEVPITIFTVLYYLILCGLFLCTLFMYIFPEMEQAEFLYKYEHYDKATYHLVRALFASFWLMVTIYLLGKK